MPDIERILKELLADRRFTESATFTSRTYGRSSHSSSECVYIQNCHSIGETVILKEIKEERNEHKASIKKVHMFTNRIGHHTYIFIY